MNCLSGRFAIVLLLLSTWSTGASADPLADAMRDVTRLRKQHFLSTVTSQTITRDELPRRLQAQLEKTQPYSFGEYSDQLRTLYLVRESGDLLPPLLALLQSQVLAYYDPDTDQFFFVTPPPAGLPDEAGGMLEKSVVSHELVHALQDQRLDISKRDRDLADDWDASMAFHAVLEGEATLVMMASLLDAAGVSLDDMIANETVLNSALSLASAAPVEANGAPAYFVETLKYPYIQGLRFVVAAYRRGGWPAVDALLTNPPRSTREINHPDEFFARSLPQRPFRPTPMTPHRFGDVRLGTESWAILLGAAPEGWIDDRAAVLLDEACRPTVLVTSEWESEAAAKAFAARYETFLDKQNAAATVTRDGHFVRAAYGFDAPAIRAFFAQEMTAGKGVER